MTGYVKVRPYDPIIIYILSIKNIYIYIDPYLLT